MLHSQWSTNKAYTVLFIKHVNANADKPTQFDQLGWRETKKENVTNLRIWLECVSYGQSSISDGRSRGSELSNGSVTARKEKCIGVNGWWTDEVSNDSQRTCWSETSEVRPALNDTVVMLTQASLTAYLTERNWMSTDLIISDKPDAHFEFDRFSICHCRSSFRHKRMITSSSNS